jgi:hypothetical protein
MLACANKHCFQRDFFFPGRLAVQLFTLVQTRVAVLSPRLADRRQNDAIITLGEATTKLLLSR